MARQIRNICHLCQSPAPDGLTSCPRCGQATVYASFPYGEPMCDHCDWTASDGAA